jgi:hypothetical protein
VGALGISLVTQIIESRGSRFNLMRPRAPLSTFIHLAGAYAVPLPPFALRAVNRVQRAFRLSQYDYASFPEAITYHCLLDTTRAREVMEYSPQYHIKFG